MGIKELKFHLRRESFMVWLHTDDTMLPENLDFEIKLIHALEEEKPEHFLSNYCPSSAWVLHRICCNCRIVILGIVIAHSIVDSQAKEYTYQ